ncbi:hypothetical protein BJY52DRAFT_401629 [Lactarius psammicola]|nr:hypothetical protein BJY52DRAFT_401629 [Lactarius psammicola]
MLPMCVSGSRRSCMWVGWFHSKPAAIRSIQASAAVVLHFGSLPSAPVTRSEWLPPLCDPIEEVRGVPKPSTWVTTIPYAPKFSLAPRLRHSAVAVGLQIPKLMTYYNNQVAKFGCLLYADIPFMTERSEKVFSLCFESPFGGLSLSNIWPLGEALRLEGMVQDGE